MAETGTALTRADPTAWNIACNREPVIRALSELPKVRRSDLLDACAKLGLGRSRVFELVARYRDNPVTTSLMDRRDGFPKGRKRLAPEIDRIVDEEIEVFYLKRPKPTLAQLIRDVEHACKVRTLRPPARKTIASRLAELDQQRVVRARDGNKAADDQYRPVTHSYAADYPLHIVQMDHTPADFIIVDDMFREALARPALSLSIDIYSRVIPGYYLSLECPSATSVGMAIRHAVLPKTTWLEERGIDVDHPVWGLNHTLHLDNAPEFRSHALKRGCQQHGIELLHRPKRTPHYGGHIERLIGTMIGEVHLLPGTTFSSVAAKGDYDAEGNACMTLREFEHWFALQVGIYHNTIHRELGVTPLTAWNEGLAKRPHPLRLPADPAAFLLDFLPFEMRKIRREGIELFHAFYWHGALARLIGAFPHKVPIKYNPLNLSVVYVELPSGEYLTVPLRDRRRPAITKFEHDRAVAAQRERGRQSVDEQALFDMVAAQRQIVIEAIGKTKAARKSAQRIVNALEAGYPAPIASSPTALFGPHGHQTAVFEDDTEPIIPLQIEERP